MCKGSDNKRELVPNYEMLPESIKRHIPNFEYLLYDLSEVTLDLAKLQMEHFISARMLSRARYASIEEIGDILAEGIVAINSAEGKTSIPNYLYQCIKYVYGVRPDISIEQMHEVEMKISTKGGNIMMSVAEKLEEKGIEKGIEKGMEKAKLDIARELLLEGGFTKERIAKISKLSLEKVEGLEKELR